MDLNEWSLVLFGFHLLFISSLSIALVMGPSLIKFGTALLFWFLQQAAFLVYGIMTGQSGFVLIAMSEFFIAGVMMIFSSKIVSSDDSK